jgi:hypothetical protein
VFKLIKHLDHHLNVECPEKLAPKMNRSEWYHTAHLSGMVFQFVKHLDPQSIHLKCRPVGPELWLMASQKHPQ